MTTRAQRGIITGSIMLATVMQTLDSTIANVALPHMQGSMAATQDQIAWVLTSYIIAAAIATPATGFLSVRFGRKRLLAISVVGFTVTSMLCGAAQSLDQIVIFRLAQGACGAAFVPLSQAIMLDMYTMEQRGKMMALWGVGVMVGPIVGPALGGYLTDAYSWRWVFYINVPFGILAFMGIMSAMSEGALDKVRRFDWLGFTFLSLAIGSMQLMLDRGNIKDWFSANEIVVEGLIAAFALYLFIVHSMTAKRPFIDLHLFKDRNLLVGLVLMFTVGLVLYATMALLPPYLETLMDYPVVTTGLVLAPRGIGTMAAMVLAGRIINRVDMRLLISFGLALAAFSLWEMTRFNLDISERTIITTGVVQGFGLGFIFAPLTTISFATLAPHLRTDGTAFYSLLRNVGSSVGISTAEALVATLTQINHAQLASRMDPTNPIFRPEAMPRGFGLDTPLGLALMNGEITRQAAAIAYLDDFRVMMFMTILVIPLVYLMRAPKMGAMGAAPSKDEPVHVMD
ncbi:MAG: DHA2 family efflux MFS transporter permease subunit [Parvibaculum sp.]|jgi:DHA2 family multidrug resistance protein|uniref:DHA2 family efflux MFS transporter permease subunit n=1 Tax=Parvibaculum sp. TaxID=2024848 RepID=UPI00284ED657|nr:DHA2 family efflux MFS transporter permease subunit [Parvibaculum sp.]MDR3497856.1 DHA2 family efflux MFS transporter permease subunit [Parvibaculum sp.]